MCSTTLSIFFIFLTISIVVVEACDVANGKCAFFVCNQQICIKCENLNNKICVDDMKPGKRFQMDGGKCVEPEEENDFLDMLANGTFLDDIGKWMSSDSFCNKENANNTSASTTIELVTKIGENSSATENSDFTVAHSPTSGLSAITETPTTSTLPPPPGRANFSWDYKKMKEVNEINETIKEQGFRIIGNVLENWKLINFQMLSNKSDKNELLLNLTINSNKTEGKIIVGDKMGIKVLPLENFNISGGERIEFLYRDNILDVNGIGVHTVVEPEDMLKIKIIGDIDQNSIISHPIYTLPMLYIFPTATNDSFDASFNDACALLSINGKVNNNSAVDVQDFYIDLIYRYKYNGLYFEEVLHCYDSDEGYCDVLLQIYTNFRVVNIKGETDNYTQYNTLRLYEVDMSNFEYDREWIKSDKIPGTIFHIGEEFHLQVKICNKTNFLINVNGVEVKHYSVQLEKRLPNRWNVPHFVRIHTSYDDNFPQLTLYGFPRLTKEEGHK